MNILHPSSGQKIYREDGGITFLRNVDKRLQDYAASHLRKYPTFYFFLYTFFILFAFFSISTFVLDLT
jgi:hypothetical protein